MTTKYMKIKQIDGRSLFIDLYKINNISEDSAELRLYDFTNNEHIGIDKPHRFITSFTAPGARGGLRVCGTAQELIEHIQQQQQNVKRRRKVEPYEPEPKLYTESGEAHPLNKSFVTDDPCVRFPARLFDHPTPLGQLDKVA